MLALKDSLKLNSGSELRSQSGQCEALTEVRPIIFLVEWWTVLGWRITSSSVINMGEAHNTAPYKEEDKWRKNIFLISSISSGECQSDSDHLILSPRVGRVRITDPGHFFLFLRNDITLSWSPVSVGRERSRTDLLLTNNMDQALCEPGRWQSDKQGEHLHCPAVSSCHISDRNKCNGRQWLLGISYFSLSCSPNKTIWLTSQETQCERNKRRTGLYFCFPRKIFLGSDVWHQKAWSQRAGKWTFYSIIWKL